MTEPPPKYCAPPNNADQSLDPLAYVQPEPRNVQAPFEFVATPTKRPAPRQATPISTIKVLSSQVDEEEVEVRIQCSTRLCDSYEEKTKHYRCKKEEGTERLAKLKQQHESINTQAEEKMKAAMEAAKQEFLATKSANDAYYKPQEDDEARFVDESEAKEQLFAGKFEKEDGVRRNLLLQQKQLQEQSLDDLRENVLGTSGPSFRQPTFADVKPDEEETQEDCIAEFILNPPPRANINGSGAPPSGWIPSDLSDATVPDRLCDMHHDPSQVSGNQVDDPSKIPASDETLGDDESAPPNYFVTQSLPPRMPVPPSTRAGGSAESVPPNMAFHAPVRIPVQPHGSAQSLPPRMTVPSSARARRGGAESVPPNMAFYAPVEVPVQPHGSAQSLPPFHDPALVPPSAWALGGTESVPPNMTHTQMNLHGHRHHVQPQYDHQGRQLVQDQHPPGYTQQQQQQQQHSSSSHQPASLASNASSGGSGQTNNSQRGNGCRQPSNTSSDGTNNSLSAKTLHVLETGSLQEIRAALGLKTFRDIHATTNQQLKGKFPKAVKKALEKNNGEGIAIIADPFIFLSHAARGDILKDKVIALGEPKLPGMLLTVDFQVYVAAYLKIQVPVEYQCLLPDWATQPQMKFGAADLAFFKNTKKFAELRRKISQPVN